MTTKERNTKILVFSAIGVLAALMYGHKASDQTLVANFASDSVIGQGKPVLLELGTQLSSPCRKTAAALNELAKEYPGQFTIAYRDVQKDYAAVKKYRISAVPAQIFYDKDGNELFRHEGSYSKAEILAKWKELGLELSANEPNRPN
jgi:thioredoxin 1